MSTYIPKFLAVATVVVAMLSASDTRGDPLSTGIVIRGIAPTLTCGGKTVVPDANRNREMQVVDLSVNCTDATTNINNFALYTGGLPNLRFCVAKITQIVRNNGRVDTAPTETNPLHCVINKITVKKLVSKMTRRP